MCLPIYRLNWVRYARAWCICRARAGCSTDAGGRTNALVESGRGTHHGAVAEMSGRVKARAGRLAADLLGSATHAVTPDDPEGGLALGQKTLLKDKVKAITAATAHI